MSFLHVNPALLFSRGDNQDPRLGEWVRTPSNADESRFALIGYPDDEGIRLNGGRPGANTAPDTIRQFLYRMTPPRSAASLGAQGLSLTDHGNLSPQCGTLEQRHNKAQTAALETLRAGTRLVTLGGGHDYGFPDAAAFVESLPASGPRPLVINFDAHLDVRPLDKGLTSGTPFFRLLESYPEIDFAEIGLQEHCNSHSHWAWAENKGARLLDLNEFLFSGVDWNEVMVRKLEPWLIRRRPAFISVDIDAFSSAYAPGCSQSWATGLDPSSFFVMFQTLLRRLDVRGLGVYEVSPALDTDNRTSKLAAQIIYRFLFHEHI